MKVCIVYDCLGASRFFENAGWEVTRDTVTPDVDLVCLTGGADISPSLYGEPKHHSTWPSEGRDRQDWAAMSAAAAHGIPVFGICRGSQILTAFNGGRLWQDVYGHANGDHMIYTPDGAAITQATSLHHQALIPDARAQIIAEAPCVRGTRYDTEAGEFVTVHDFMLPEAVLFNDDKHNVKGFGVQGHPEMSRNKAYIDWTLDQLNRLLKGA